MQQQPVRVQKITLACVIMHNILQKRYPNLATQLVDVEDAATHEVTPGGWRDEETLLGLARAGGNTGLQAAKLQRDYLRNYYNSVGAVAWQEAMV
jgi:hypothetical protein